MHVNTEMIIIIVVPSFVFHMCCAWVFTSLLFAFFFVSLQVLWRSFGLLFIMEDYLMVLNKSIQGDFQNVLLCLVWISQRLYQIFQAVRLFLPLLPLWLLCCWEFKGEARVKHGGSIWDFLAPRWKISAHMGSLCPLRWIFGKIAAGYHCASRSSQI